MKEIDSLGSVNFSDLSIHPGVKFPVPFKYLDFEKYDEKSCLIPISRFMVWLWHNTKTTTLCWFRLSLEASSGSPGLVHQNWHLQVKWWTDLAPCSLSNIKSIPRSLATEQLQPVSKKPSESLDNTNRAGVGLLPKCRLLSLRKKTALSSWAPYLQHIMIGL